MREIKFKCWDDKLKMWAQLSTKITLDGKILLHKGPASIEETEYKLCQYIGCKDRWGEEIYEGDVIKVIVTDGPGLGEFICEVKYIKNGFFAYRKEDFYFEKKYNFENTSKWDYDRASGEHRVTYEKIGNIYENPELIKS